MSLHCESDDCCDARIAHLKHQFESARAMLRQMERLPELSTLLGASERAKSSKCGNTRLLGGENGAEKKESKTNQTDKTTRTTSCEVEKTSTSSLNFPPTSSVTVRDSRAAKANSGGESDNGHVTQTKCPTLSHSTRENDSPSRVRYSKKSKLNLVTKSKQEKEIDFTMSVSKKVKTERLTDVVMAKTQTVEGKKVHKPYKQMEATVVDSYDKKVWTNKEAAKGPPRSTMSGLTTHWLSQFPAHDGRLVYNQLLGARLPVDFARVCPAVQTSQLVYGPTLVGRDGLPYRYVWTTPSWMTHYPDYAMTLDNTNFRFRHPIHNHGHLTGGFPSNISTDMLQRQPNLKTE
ncbi:uncharacterized protein LOC134192129 [Corticium candelabrum]|uniref:uncharacterized protein LOC134192129 n=1 Tax=Corticium candelabrum TaxID=121492 RepID=UPI002E27214C|nr:uncharacterized protein LOC134192129 [Corticium candelabrum]